MTQGQVIKIRYTYVYIEHFRHFSISVFHFILLSGSNHIAKTQPEFKVK